MIEMWRWWKGRANNVGEGIENICWLTEKIAEWEERKEGPKKRRFEELSHSELQMPVEMMLLATADCSQRRGRKTEELLQSWAHSPPASRTPSAVSQGILGEGRGDRRLPSSHSNYIIEKFVKIDTRFVFDGRRVCCRRVFSGLDLNLSRWRFNRPSHAGDTVCYWPIQNILRGSTKSVHVMYWQVKMISDNDITKQGKSPMKKSQNGHFNINQNKHQNMQNKL